MPENEKPTPIPDDPEQSKRFEEAARMLEADASGMAFERAIKTVAPSKRPAKIPHGT